MRLGGTKRWTVIRNRWTAAGRD